MKNFCKNTNKKRIKSDFSKKFFTNILSPFFHRLSDNGFAKRVCITIVGGVFLIADLHSREVELDDCAGFGIVLINSFNLRFIIIFIWHLLYYFSL